jgi:ABC-type multidrug transport system fused ATPase/permease subunit
MPELCKFGNYYLFSLLYFAICKFAYSPYILYPFYFDSSFHRAFICLCLYGVAQACQISTNFWLRYWITADEREGEEDRPRYFYLAGYASLVLLFLVVDVTVNYMANVVCGIRSARILYNRLFTRVLRYPMSTFDTTP